MASAQTANSNDLFPIDSLWKSYHLTLGLDPALILTLRYNQMKNIVIKDSV